MIIVTGGAGFIGSNLIKKLNEAGRDDVIAVDDLIDGTKFKNLTDCKLLDYLDKDDFLEKIKSGFKFSPKIDAIFHEGACSNTMEWDGRFMMKNNYEYSKILLDYCLKNTIPFIYASSAAVYGGSTTFVEDIKYEKPLNVYGYSKWLFDQQVRRILSDAKNQIVGLRYFNVYGPRENHKGSMASVAYHHYQQLLKGDVVKLFEGSDGYGPGEQQRDFVFIDDVVRVNLWFLENPHKKGIFNLGTGRSQNFNDVANAVIAWFKKGKIEYIPFPESLKGRYQSFTQADISTLRTAGYQEAFHTVEEGVKKYLDWLESASKT